MEKKRFLLRLSPDLWEEMSRWAADELRSVNGQIEYVLRQAVRQHRGGLPLSSRGNPAGKRKGS